MRHVSQYFLTEYSRIFVKISLVKIKQMQFGYNKNKLKKIKFKIKFVVLFYKNKKNDQLSPLKGDNLLNSGLFTRRISEVFLRQLRYYPLVLLIYIFFVKKQ